MSTTEVPHACLVRAYRRVMERRAAVLNTTIDELPDELVTLPVDEAASAYLASLNGTGLWPEELVTYSRMMADAVIGALGSVDVDQVRELIAAYVRDAVLTGRYSADVERELEAALEPEASE
jgi:hypothetical protein